MNRREFMQTAAAGAVAATTPAAVPGSSFGEQMDEARKIGLPPGHVVQFTPSHIGDNHVDALNWFIGGYEEPTLTDFRVRREVES